VSNDSTPREPGPFGAAPDDPSPVDRRDFLKLAGAGAGILALTGCPSPTASGAGPTPGFAASPSIAVPTGSSTEVVVVGAGLWGSYTAYSLRRRGVKVTLVDQYGPGNSRATSGDETRGVRSTYGDRATGELWMLWARESMKRWQEFDREWAKYWKIEVYAKTGDILLRTDDSENIIRRTRDWWLKHKVPFNVLPIDYVKKTWPVMDVNDMGYALYEGEAGVLRSRRAAQYAAAAMEKMGGRVVIGRATKLNMSGGKLNGIELDTGEKLRADYFVFALGPWLRTFFTEVLGDRMNTPLAQVCYFATPPGDERFTHPNLPSWNFPGVTGWAALPVDNRGFRVRGGMAAPQQPAGGAAGADSTGRGRGAGAGAGGGAAGRGAGAVAGAVAGAAADSVARGAAPGRGNAGRGRGGAAGDSTGRGGAGRAGAAGDSTGRGRAGAAGGAAAGAAGRGGAAGGGGRGGGGGGGGGAGATNDPDRSDRAANLASIESSRRFVARRFPLLAETPISETRQCHYEGSINRDFIIDWHPEMSNVLLAGAGNSEGAKFGILIGDYVAQRVTGNLGDPEVAKRFVIPQETYTTQQLAQSAAAIIRAKQDTLTGNIDTTAGRGRGRGTGRGGGAAGGAAGGGGGGRGPDTTLFSTPRPSDDPVMWPDVDHEAPRWEQDDPEEADEGLI
jgi:sarcosine oxidase